MTDKALRRISKGALAGMTFCAFAFLENVIGPGERVWLLAVAAVAALNFAMVAASSTLDQRKTARIHRERTLHATQIALKEGFERGYTARAKEDQ